MGLVVVWPNAAAGAITVLRDQLPNRPEAYAQNATVVAHVPDDRTVTSANPLVMCRPDGATATQVVDQRAVVRLTCWHASEFQALALTGLCQALLIAHTGPDMRGTEYVSGPVPGVDPYNSQPLATCVVAVHMRPQVA